MAAAAKWECHVCTKLNAEAAAACCVCGRARTRRTRKMARGSAANPLILQDTVRAMRPEQVQRFLEEALAALPTVDKTKLPRSMLTLGTAELERQVRLIRLSGPGGPVNAADEGGYTAAHLCCCSDNVGVLRVLVDEGLLVEVETKDQGWRPLHMCAMHDAMTCLTFLLDKGVAVDPTTRGLGQTPLHLSATRRVAEVLLSHGADPLRADACLRSPMHCFALEDRVDAARAVFTAASDDYTRAFLAFDADHFVPEQLAELHGHDAFVHFCRLAECDAKRILMEELPPRKWHSPAWDAFKRIFDEKARGAHRKKRQVAVRAREDRIISEMRTNIAHRKHLDLENRQLALLRQNDDDENNDDPRRGLRLRLARRTEAAMPPSGTSDLLDDYLQNRRDLEQSFLVRNQGVYTRSYSPPKDPWETHAALSFPRILRN